MESHDLLIRFLAQRAQPILVVFQESNVKSAV